jgi:hypothetical protein
MKIGLTKFVRNLERKRKIGRPNGRVEYNTEIDINLLKPTGFMYQQI